MGKIHELRQTETRVCVFFFRNEPAAASKLTWQFKLELAHTMLVKVHQG